MINTRLRPFVSPVINLLLFRSVWIGVYKSSISLSSKNEMFSSDADVDPYKILKGVFITSGAYFVV